MSQINYKKIVKELLEKYISVLRFMKIYFEKGLSCF